MDNLLIKGKFVCFEKEFYGLFMILIQPETGRESYLCAAGRSSFISTYSVETAPEKLVSIIRELINDEEASIEKSREIKTLLETNINTIKTSMNNALGELDHTLMEMLTNFIQARIELSITIEKTDTVQFSDVEKEKIDKDTKEQNEEFRSQYKIPPNANVVDCFTVLSPIKGKAIQDIREDDLVLVKINDTTEKGQDIAVRYNLYNENKKLKPVIGRVYKKVNEGQEVVLVLELAKNVLMGLAREDESVKVSFVERDKIISKHEVERKKQLQNTVIPENKQEKKQKTKNEVMIMLAIGAFVIVLAIILMVIS